MPLIPTPSTSICHSNCGVLETPHLLNVPRLKLLPLLLCMLHLNLKLRKVLDFLRCRLTTPQWQRQRLEIEMMYVDRGFTMMRVQENPKKNESNPVNPYPEASLFPVYPPSVFQENSPCSTIAPFLPLLRSDASIVLSSLKLSTLSSLLLTLASSSPRVMMLSRCHLSHSINEVRCHIIVLAVVLLASSRPPPPSSSNLPLSLSPANTVGDLDLPSMSNFYTVLPALPITAMPL
jgi:hypothetical protein